MQRVRIKKGENPLILCQPHSGTFVPVEILSKLNSLGLKLADTDWHVDRLYRGLAPKATVIRANFHRYVIDANRDPSGQSLYPGQNTTGLCPLTDFDGLDIYRNNKAPNADDIQERRHTFHAPYHQAIETQIARLKRTHKNVVVYDCHSIRSHVPYLFPGTLPDFNIGTNMGLSCDAKLEDIVTKICENALGYNTVRNGRFKGGWTTRHYGRPAEGIHAVQMELAQSTYMLEHPPWTYNTTRARQTRRVLKNILDTLEQQSRLSTH